MSERKRSHKGLIALIVLAVLFAGGFIGVKTLYFKEEKEFSNEEFVAEDEKEDNGRYLTELRGLNDLSGILKSWAVPTADEDLMRSDDVINFLIIGSDGNEYNADVCMICSLNKVDKRIYLTSVMRDSYTYIPTSSENKFAKINSAYGIGGAEKLIETVQNDFKIKIDHYASVNFTTFVQIVDVMGGIRLDVPQYVAEALGSGFPYGTGVLLNGEQALSFVRIRKSDADGDVSRTGRQRQFITAVVNRSREVKLSQLVSVFKIILQYVKTDCKLTELVRYATQGIISKWYGFKIVSNAYPLAEDRLDYNGDAWVWIVDYPSAAQKLQTMVYGRTNIRLEEDRVSAIDVMRPETQAVTEEETSEE